MQISSPGFIAISVWAISLNIGLLAANASAKDGYQYPELLVVPKASQELANHAASEAKTRSSTHLLLQAPAALTLLAGLSSSGNSTPDGRTASVIATGVGATWLLTTVGLSIYYTPYRSAQVEVSAMGDKTLEQSLAKERKAEEALYFPAYLMRRLQYISAVTNFGAAVAVAAQKDNSQSSLALGAIAAASAFLPLIFDHPWISHYDQQQDYKRKIYGPMTQLTMLPDIRTGHMQPGIDFSLRF